MAQAEAQQGRQATTFASKDSKEAGSKTPCEHTRASACVDINIYKSLYVCVCVCKAVTSARTRAKVVNSNLCSSDTRAVLKNRRRK